MNIAHNVASLGAPAGTGVTIGNFDGLHLGHQALIRRTLEVCRQDGLTPVVLTFWPHPRLVLFPDQGHMPLCTRQDRLDRLTHRGVPQVLELLRQYYAAEKVCFYECGELDTDGRLCAPLSAAHESAPSGGGL